MKYRNLVKQEEDNTNQTRPPFPELPPWGRRNQMFDFEPFHPHEEDAYFMDEQKYSNWEFLIGSNQILLQVEEEDIARYNFPPESLGMWYIDRIDWPAEDLEHSEEHGAYLHKPGSSSWELSMYNPDWRITWLTYYKKKYPEKSGEPLYGEVTNEVPIEFFFDTPEEAVISLGKRNLVNWGLVIPSAIALIAAVTGPQILIRVAMYNKAIAEGRKRFLEAEARGEVPQMEQFIKKQLYRIKAGEMPEIPSGHTEEVREGYKAKLPSLKRPKLKAWHLWDLRERALRNDVIPKGLETYRKTPGGKIVPEYFSPGQLAIDDVNREFNLTGAKRWSRWIETRPNWADAFKEGTQGHEEQWYRHFSKNTFGEKTVEGDFWSGRVVKEFPKLWMDSGSLPERPEEPGMTEKEYKQIIEYRKSGKLWDAPWNIEPGKEGSSWKNWDHYKFERNFLSVEGHDVPGGGRGEGSFFGRRELFHLTYDFSRGGNFYKTWMALEPLRMIRWLNERGLVFKQWPAEVWVLLEGQESFEKFHYPKIIPFVEEVSYKELFDRNQLFHRYHTNYEFRRALQGDLHWFTHDTKIHPNDIRNLDDPKNPEKFRQKLLWTDPGEVGRLGFFSAEPVKPEDLTLEEKKRLMFRQIGKSKKMQKGGFYLKMRALSHMVSSGSQYETAMKRTLAGIKLGHLNSYFHQLFPDRPWKTPQLDYSVRGKNYFDIRTGRKYPVTKVSDLVTPGTLIRTAEMGEGMGEVIITPEMTEGMLKDAGPEYDRLFEEKYHQTLRRGSYYVHLKKHLFTRLRYTGTSAEDAWDSATSVSDKQREAGHSGRALFLFEVKPEEITQIIDFNDPSGEVKDLISDKIKYQIQNDKLSFINKFKRTLGSKFKELSESELKKEIDLLFSDEDIKRAFDVERKTPYGGDASLKLVEGVDIKWYEKKVILSEPKELEKPLMSHYYDVAKDLLKEGRVTKDWSLELKGVELGIPVESVGDLVYEEVKAEPTISTKPGVELPQPEKQLVRKPIGSYPEYQRLKFFIQDFLAGKPVPGRKIGSEFTPDAGERWAAGAPTFIGSGGKGGFTTYATPTVYFVRFEEENWLKGIYDEIAEARELEGENKRLYYERVAKDLLTDEQVRKYFPEEAMEKTTRLQKVISGGQTGADQGGLIAGRKLGLETGGTAPPGWKTERGSEQSRLERFGLIEGEPDKRIYPKRTKANVLKSDGTLLVGKVKSPGSRLTIRLAKENNKPYIKNPSPMKLQEWLIENKIRVLNVAGNRESKNKGITLRTQHLIIDSVLTDKAVVARDLTNKEYKELERLFSERLQEIHKTRFDDLRNESRRLATEYKRIITQEELKSTLDSEATQAWREYNRGELFHTSPGEGRNVLEAMRRDYGSWLDAEEKPKVKKQMLALMEAEHEKQRLKFIEENWKIKNKFSGPEDPFRTREFILDYIEELDKAKKANTEAKRATLAKEVHNTFESESIERYFETNEWKTELKPLELEIEETLQNEVAEKRLEAKEELKDVSRRWVKKLETEKITRLVRQGYSPWEIAGELNISRPAPDMIATVPLEPGDLPEYFEEIEERRYVTRDRAGLHTFTSKEEAMKYHKNILDRKGVGEQVRQKTGTATVYPAQSSPYSDYQIKVMREWDSHVQKKGRFPPRGSKLWKEYMGTPSELKGNWETYKKWALKDEFKKFAVTGEGEVLEMPPPGEELETKFWRKYDRKTDKWIMVTEPPKTEKGYVWRHYDKDKGEWVASAKDVDLDKAAEAEFLKAPKETFRVSIEEYKKGTRGYFELPWNTDFKETYFPNDEEGYNRFRAGQKSKRYSQGPLDKFRELIEQGVKEEKAYERFSPRFANLIRAYREYVRVEAHYARYVEYMSELNKEIKFKENKHKVKSLQEIVEINQDGHDKYRAQAHIKDVMAREEPRKPQALYRGFPAEESPYPPQSRWPRPPTPKTDGMWWWDNNSWKWRNIDITEGLEIAHEEREYEELQDEARRLKDERFRDKLRQRQERAAAGLPMPEEEAESRASKKFKEAAKKQVKSPKPELELGAGGERARTPPPPEGQKPPPVRSPELPRFMREPGAVAGEQWRRGQRFVEGKPGTSFFPEPYQVKIPELQRPGFVETPEGWRTKRIISGWKPGPAWPKIPGPAVGAGIGAARGVQAFMSEDLYDPFRNKMIKFPKTVRGMRLPYIGEKAVPGPIRPLGGLAGSEFAHEVGVGGPEVSTPYGDVNLTGAAMGTAFPMQTFGAHGGYNYMTDTRYGQSMAQVLEENTGVPEQAWINVAVAGGVAAPMTGIVAGAIPWGAGHVERMAGLSGGPLTWETFLDPTKYKKKPVYTP
mgnify:CR=1 FL=1